MICGYRKLARMLSLLRPNMLTKRDSHGDILEKGDILRA